jgi:hypothetical protein
LFVGLGTVETGGALFVKNTIVGITIDLAPLSTVTLIASVLVGTINALDPSAIVNIDSTTASGFGGSIVGTTNINYLDNAETIKYNPTTPTDWTVVPNTVQEGLDYLAEKIDSNYVHTQTIPSTIWNVTHNLGKRCAVQIVDVGGNEIVGNITWVNDNVVDVTFSTPLIGYVYCN